MATATAKIQVTAEDRTKKAFNNVQNSLKNLDKSFGQLKAGIGALVGIGGVGAFASQMVQTADKIGKVSAKLGISTDALQKFRFGAEQSGVATSTFDMAIQRMTRRVAEAREGTGEAKKALQEMGISLKDSSGKAKTTEQIFLEVADVMKGMTSQSDKVRLAFKLFDSEGVSLVNMMQQGSTAIKDYGQQLEAYGGIIDQKAIKATEDFNDALNLIKKQGRGIFSAIVLGAKDFIEALEDIGLKTKEVFDKTGKMNEGLDPQDLVREYGRLEKEIENLNLDLATYTDGWSLYNLLLKDQAEIDEEIAKIQNKITEALLKQYTIEESTQHINVKQVENKKAEVEALKKTSKLVVQDLSNSKAKQKLDRNSMLFSEITLQNEERLYRVTLKDLEGKGEILGVVEGLTLEQAKMLIKARQNTREQVAYEKAVEQSEQAHKTILKVVEKQQEEAQEQIEKQKSLIGWVGSFSNTFSQIIKNIKFKVDDVSGKIMMTGFSWQSFGLSILMSSPKIQRTMQSLFGFVDEAVEDLLPGLGDTSKRAEEMARRAQEIAQEVNSMTSAIEDYALQINNSNAEMLALAEIEKTYQNRVKKAQELDATHLIYLADVEKTMATLGYRVGVLRNATQAFSQSVTQFLDAVSTEGFTLYQKQLFSILKGFERGTKKAFTDLISEADKIIGATPLEPEKMSKAFKELERYMQMYVAKDYRGIIDQKMSPEDIAKRYGLTMEQLEDPVKGMFDEFRRIIDLGGIGSHTADYFRSVTEQYLPVIAGAITAMDAQTTAYNEAVSTKSKAETDMATALKGLTVILKDTIRTEFEAGKSKADLKIDLDALSAQFSALGIDLVALKSFVDTLVKVETGAMGGLVKRYPYGGSIHGPSHAGGGVKTELEGGEFVMRKSAVSQYGQDFMNQINSGRFSMGQPIQVSIYDGTGQAIDDYDSAIRVEINQRANRFNQFPSLAN
jgi:hypothetical protein